jgi:gluconokinase
MEGQSTGSGIGVVLLMGVSGAGKTTVGKALAECLGCRFADADDWHPPANVEKMRHGIPLTDEDRWPWLDAVHRALIAWNEAGEDVVLACSALKHSYRERLIGGLQTEVRVVYLRIRPEEGAHRLQVRSGHYMPASLLASQFEALEEPTAEEALIIDAEQPVERIVGQLSSLLKHPQEAT